MFDTVKNIYKSKELPGEFLLKPLKSYNRYFANKLNDSSGLANASWRASNLATCVFAYPVFGLLASLGMLIKPLGIPGIKKHNEGEMTGLNMIYTGVKHSQGYSRLGDSDIEQEGYRNKICLTQQFNKNNLESSYKAVKDSIDHNTARYRKILLNSFGTINNNKGNINVELLRRVKV